MDDKKYLEAIELKQKINKLSDIKSSFPDEKDSCCFHLVLHDNYGNRRSTPIKLYSFNAEESAALGYTVQDEIRKLFKEFCTKSREIIEEREVFFQKQFTDL